MSFKRYQYRAYTFDGKIWYAQFKKSWLHPWKNRWEWTYRYGFSWKEDIQYPHELAATEACHEHAEERLKKWKLKQGVYERVRNLGFLP